MPKEKKKKQSPIEMELEGVSDLSGMHDMIRKMMQPAKWEENPDKFKLEEIRHKNKMEEIKFEIDGKKEIEALRFDHLMQLQRIKTAEIKKSIDRRAGIDFMRDNR
jgi:hypothetical protein